MKEWFLRLIGRDVWHEHEYVYDGKSAASGWGIVRCADPTCDWTDLY